MYFAFMKEIFAVMICIVNIVKVAVCKLKSLHTKSQLFTLLSAVSKEITKRQSPFKRNLYTNR